jgi:hypothetical protein
MTPELLKQYIELVAPYLWITIFIYNATRPNNEVARRIITWEPRKKKVE